MVQRRMPKQLELIEARKLDDEEFAEDLKWLSEKLAESVQDMSSFEEFAIEVRSASLDPNSPAHRSDRFWRENAHLLNEHNHELLKMLIKLLEKQGDPQTVSIAAHDIGEYVHFHPRGKYLVEQLGGKQLLMQHLTNEDSSVKYAALIAIQKLMVHNWEYLGKQIEQTSAAATGPLGDKKAAGGALPPVPSRPGLKTG
jgi:V-type H+-transporting ATPase subunit H